VKAYYAEFFQKNHIQNYVGWAKSFFCPPASLEKFFRQKFRSAKLLPESLLPR